MGAFAAPIIGSVAGAVASKAMSGGGGSGSSSGATNEPWSGLQPYLNQLYQGAGNLYESSGGTYPYYPGSTVAEQSPYTQAGQQAILDRLGTAGVFGQGYAPASDLTQQLLSQFNPSMFGWSDLASGGFGPSSTPAGQAAFSSLMPTAMGSLLNANPYIDDMFNAQASQVADQFRYGTSPALQSMFSQAGRYGSQAMTNQFDQLQQGFGTSLNRLAANTYGQNYANERQNMLNAAQQLGALGTQDINAQIQGLQGLQSSAQYDTQNQLQMLPYLLSNANLDINQLMQLGQQQQAYNQQLINADQARWNYNTQQANYLPLQQFASILGNQTQSYGTQPRADVMGGALGGLQLGSAFQNMFSGGNTFGGTPFNYGGGGGTGSYGLNTFQSTPDYGFGASGGFGGSSLYSY